ncbi:tRNA (adenosine(37)-N6)-threonylcarbamoyltransferase complex ATPase subunit type 1 TsaE [Candidatus Saccharibacteria bacterium]|nr:tRNA (adenosine(37)-N6)-threonylcarbamoyltransferase complex ATPase subunit type 1 TsaE [Candidatus Saccharibacteria bacterium]
MIIEVTNEKEMRAFGARLGRHLKGGEVLELVGDVGSGKTTLTKGIAIGLGVDEDVQSPSFTISRVYDARDGLTLAHYDFYRLGHAGIMADELHETILNPRTVTVIEWGGIVEGALPTDRLTLSIVSPTETTRRIIVEAHGLKSRKIEQLL